MVLFLGLWIIVLLMEDLNMLLKKDINATALDFIKFYLYKIPFISLMLLPISSLFAVVYTLGKMNSQNELIAIFNSGTTVGKVMRPTIIFVFTICLFLFNGDHFIYDLHMKHILLGRKFRTGVMEVEKVLPIRNNLTIFGVDNKIYFIKTYEPKTSTMSFAQVLYLNSDFSFHSVVSGDSFHYNIENDRWYGSNVFVRYFSSNGQTALILQSNQMTINFKDKPFHFESRRDRVDYMSANEVRELAKKTEIVGGEVRQNWTEYYSRTAAPFLSLIVLLLGIPLSTYSRRGSMVISLFLVLLITGVYYLTTNIGASLGANGILPPFFAGWFGNITFLAVALYLNKRLLL